MSQSFPVVIAGAGPTGLMCALALAREGVRVVVCEAEPTPDARPARRQLPPADAGNDGALRHHGSMHEQGGLQVRQWQVRSRRGGMVAEFDLGLLADVTPYPYRLHLEQHRLTPIMLDLLRGETNAEVHFGHRVTGFEHRAHSVLVKFESEGIPGKVEAAWLIGADGGRSTIRNRCRSSSRASPGPSSSWW